MNTYIKSVLSKLFPKELPKPMGRWGMENTSKQINQKVDLSNEDHCGPCGQYALSKIEPKKTQTKERYIPDKKKI
jgi:hypothetical protein